MEKVSNAAGAKLWNLKRMKDFDEMILPARKVARTGAERKAKSRSGRTPEQIEKEREEERVRLVDKRAGGLDESRKREMYPPKLYSRPTIQSRSAAQRVAQDLVYTNL